MLKALRGLDDSRVLSVVSPDIQKNAFIAYYEDNLQAVICDERPRVRTTFEKN